MAEYTSLIANAADDDDDAYWLSKLANNLAARIPMLCKLRTFYDGAEQVPTNAIPSGVDAKAYAIYQRFLALGTVNYARIIADTVSSRQQPIGFRQVSDKAMRSVEADTAWADNRMDLKARQMFHDVSLYGSGFLLITGYKVPRRIEVISPWEAWVDGSDDAAIMYTYNERERKERIRLFRCERNENAELVDVTVRTAVRDADKRSLIAEDDAESIYRICNDPNEIVTGFPTDFEWETASETLSYAKDCGYLPLIRLGSGTGMGQFEPHLPMLGSLDQQRFDRFCIQTMQSFRQRGVKGMKRTVYEESDIQVINGQKKAGDPIDYSEAFSMGPAGLWMLPEGADIWESQTTDIQQWVTANSADVKQLAAATGTPLDILSPDVAGSAEGASLKRETLVFKVAELNARANDALVRALRMAMVAEGTSSAADDRFETVWKPVAPDSDLSMAQSANFVKDILSPKTIMRRFLHMTETEISEAMQDRADSTYQSALMTATAATDAAKQAPEDSSGGFARVDDSPDGVKVLVDVDGEANG